MALLFLKMGPLGTMIPNGDIILALTLLATSAPAANTVTQMAQVYNRDAEYASACSVVTTLCCVVTMPVMLLLYQL
jgi:hypothetical protein